MGYLLERIAVKRNEALYGKVSLSLFWRIFTGTLLMISIYAIITTKALTIFLVCPVFLFFLVRQKPAETGVSNDRQQIMFFVSSVILNFGFYLFSLTSFTTESVNFVSGDFNIYFRIAQKFNEYGVENASLDPIFRPNYPIPYHYGDIWMYAIVSRFASINPSVIFLISFSHFSVIFINGLYTYIKKIFSGYLIEGKIYVYLLLFAGLFTGFNLFFPKFILPSAEPYTLSVMNWSKVLVPSTVFVGLLILAHQKNWRALVILAIIGGLSFINALPAIFMSVFLLLTFNVLRHQISIKHWFFYNAFFVLTSVSFILVLYKLMPLWMGIPNHQQVDGISLLQTMDLKRYLRTATNIFIGGWFQLFVLIPYFIILIIGLFVSGKLKDFKKLLLYIDNSFILLFLIIFSGLCCWALLHNFDVNSVQFFSNVLSPFSAILISIIIMYVFYVLKNKWISILSVFTIIACIYAHRSDQFFVTSSDKKDWNNLNQYLNNKGDNSVFVNIKASSTFNSFFEKYTTIFIPLNILSYKWSTYENISLNAPFIPVNPKSVFLAEETTVVNSAPFMVYYKKMLKRGYKDISQISIQFIKDYNVGYISVAKDTSLPQYFRYLVKDSLVQDKGNFIVYRVK
ncbi:MAG: hypothetical protein V4561_13720 [Bacteroidota bacterium]